MLLLLAATLVFLCSFFLIAIIRPPARPAALLGVYLLSFANIVLVGEITNTFLQLNNPALWLLLHLALAIAAWLAWNSVGQPDLKAPWLDAEGRLFPRLQWTALRSWPDVFILGAGVAVFVLFELVLIWVVAPNTNDSMSTHMARIGYWLQHGSFFPWPTPRVWQITYPVNMQLQMFWTALFLGSDRLVEMVQWLGSLAAMAAVYGLARLLGAARPPALFAALLLATLPEIILESTTTQNDLVAGTLFATMLYLLFAGLRGRHPGTLALSGLALALGLGTKQTLFFLLPGLALVLALLLVFHGKTALRPLAVWAVSAAAAFVLFSAYMFVVNQVNFGHAMGKQEAVSAQTGSLTLQSVRDSLLYTAPRFVYQFFDPTGLPDPICGYSFKLKALVVGQVTRLANFSLEAPVALATGHQFVLRTRYIPSEDAAWYGPLFAFLVLPALIVQFYRGVRTRDALRISIFLLAFSYLLINSLLRPGWDPYQGRYFIPVVMLSTALAALVARPNWLVLRLVIAGLALVIGTNTFLQNAGKPLSGPHMVWYTNRVSQLTQQSFYMRDTVRMVEQVVPADATLGLLTYGTFQEYAFFGENFRRRLVQIEPAAKIQDVNWLANNGIEYVLVLAPPGSPPVNAPSELAVLVNQGDWTILKWGAGE